MKSATWKYDLPNGNYLISLACGDPQYDKGAQRVVVEGTIVVQDVELPKNNFATITDVPVSVADGQLSVQVIAVGREEAAINYIIIKKAPSK